MKIRSFAPNQKSGSAIMAVLIMMLIVITAVASLTAYVTGTTRLSTRRIDATSAIQFAQGGAAIAAADLGKCLTNSSVSIFNGLLTNGYTLSTSLGVSGVDKVYVKTNTAPFSNQTVMVQVWMTNAAMPTDAKIRAITTVRDVTQTVTLNVRFIFGFGAAIISDSPGSTSTGTGKGDAQDGNVVVSGSGLKGVTLVDGGNGLAIWANGNANVDLAANVPGDAVLDQTYGTGSQIPDYTLEGSSDQLFDFRKFIAVSDVSGTHYTNLDTFIKANNVASSNSAIGALEGVVVVDIGKKDKRLGDLTESDLPKGINVRGTLLFNFSSEFDGSDKIINTATMNINKANLTGMVATNPATYPTGYPPTYVDPTKKPSAVNITAKLDSAGNPFVNFSPTEDLPALMYNVGVLDIHGNANICGVVYSPSFMEIENKQSDQIQYFKGALIGGGGIFFDNGSGAISICSYDPGALDRLATSGAKGKRLAATYWE